MDMKRTGYEAEGWGGSSAGLCQLCVSLFEMSELIGFCFTGLVLGLRFFLHLLHFTVLFNLIVTMTIPF